MPPTESDVTPPAPIEPRLRFWGVVLRGALYGVAALTLTTLVALSIADHGTREKFLEYVLVFSAMLALGLPLGALMWPRGDVRRWRDWRTVTGRFSGGTIGFPISVRVGTACLLLCPAVFLLYQAVDNAGYGTFLYGR